MLKHKYKNIVTYLEIVIYYVLLWCSAGEQRAGWASGPVGSAVRQPGPAAQKALGKDPARFSLETRQIVKSPKPGGGGGTCSSPYWSVSGCPGIERPWTTRERTSMVAVGSERSGE